VNKVKLLIAMVAMLMLVAAPALAYVSIQGTQGPDRLVGSKKSEKLRGYGGADRIYPNGGHDRPYGGPGNDVIVMGKTDRAYDHVNCGDGYDTVRQAQDMDWGQLREEGVLKVTAKLGSRPWQGRVAGRG
jgi:hypothetical protein